MTPFVAGGTPNSLMEHPSLALAQGPPAFSRLFAASSVGVTGKNKAAPIMSFVLDRTNSFDFS
jgi:hypothetical protein